MIIFPAIDIKDGRVVRLLQGKFDKVTEYDKDPVVAAKQWESMGAEWLHVVDLDGAKSGKIKNMEHILKIAQGVKIPVQVGGGIRSQEDVAQLIEGGVSRAILGTKVIEDSAFLVEMISIWKDKIAVSLDCKNGMIMRRGWTKASDIRATEYVSELEILGLSCLIYTDIARDGMMIGPNFKALREILAATKIPVIASGGIGNLRDIERLVSLQKDGLIGAITGKAIYEGKLNLKEALELSKG